jgi:hypothetical protein
MSFILHELPANAISTNIGKIHNACSIRRRLHEHNEAIHSNASDTRVRLWQVIQKVIRPIRFSYSVARAALSLQVCTLSDSEAATVTCMHRAEQSIADWSVYTFERIILRWISLYAKSVPKPRTAPRHFTRMFVWGGGGWRTKPQVAMPTTIKTPNVATLTVNEPTKSTNGQRLHASLVYCIRAISTMYPADWRNYVSPPPTFNPCVRTSVCQSTWLAMFHAPRGLSH